MKKIVQGQHFVEEGFRSHAKFMSEQAYGESLDSLVIACVDIAVINDLGEMLLGLRSREPLPDWYIIGGRMKPGESFKEAASRNIQRELGIEVDATRFQYLCTCSYVWARRTQHPQNNGSHTVSIIMLLRIARDEISLLTPNDEYENIQWMKLEKIAAYHSFHPALPMIAENVIAYLAKQ